MYILKSTLYKCWVHDSFRHFPCVMTAMEGLWVSFETSPWTFLYTFPYSTCSAFIILNTMQAVPSMAQVPCIVYERTYELKTHTKKKNSQQKNAIWTDIRIDLENHLSKSPPLLTFLFYNTSCVSLISFSNIFSNTLLPVSSGYVHPRPITAVNHKGKHCWRKLCGIFAFVSQSDTRIGGCEIKGISDVFLSHWQQMNQYAEACFWLVLDEFESSHMFASQNDFYLCIDLSILPLEWGWILLYLLAWKRWMVKNSFEQLRGELKCARTYPDVVKDIHLNITASGTISVLTAPECK